MSNQDDGDGGIYPHKIFLLASENVHKVDVECLQALQAVPPQSFDRRGELYQRGIES
jgi:hypothetical protein